MLFTIISPDKSVSRVSTPLRYLLTPPLLKVSADALKELGWREMERVAAFPGLTDANAEPRLCIPGGGITKGLYTDRYREGERELCQRFGEVHIKS